MTLMRIVRRLCETIGGLWALVILGFRTRFRMRGKYWRWRYETAFGHDPDKYTTRRQRFFAMIEYGKWVHRMKKRM
jgi:hypothetical protein